MTITLRIENCDSLPDGGPTSYVSRGDRFEIGRETHMDWTLPDPNRLISGRHCEIRFDKGAYWLNDVSRNGTFVNGASVRVKSPYRIADGDRLQIGHYLVAVSVLSEGAAEEVGGGADGFSFGGGGIWDTGEPAPAPIDRRELMPPPKRGRRDVDFSEQFLEMPSFQAPPPLPPGADPFADPAPRQRPVAAPPPPPPPQPDYSHPVGMPPPPRSAPGVPDPGFGAPPAPVPPASPAYPPAPFHGQGEPFAAPPRGLPQPAAPAYQQPYPPASPQPYPHPAPPPSYPQPGPPPSYPQPAPAAHAAPPRAAGGDLLARIAAGARVSPDVFSGRDPGEVADEIGQILRLVVEELSQLLRARAAAKVLARSSNRTMISALDNNPLKFVPLPEEAMEVMFARRRAGYLDARRSVEESFRDLKTHEFATWAAMQKALSRLLDDLSPETIEKKVPSSAFASKKGRAWEIFVSSWEAKAESHEHGMLDVFLAYFAEAYEKAAREGGGQGR